MTARQALAFVKANGVVLESARGPAPNLAERIAGEPIRGSWWGHRKAAQIFRCSRAVRDSKEVLVCRLVEGKVTYVHRRLWPALVNLETQFARSRLSAIREVHTPQGKHKNTTIAFPNWVPKEVLTEAARLTFEEAAEMLPLKLRPKREH
jgi:hypothetical protein